MGRTIIDEHKMAMYKNESSDTHCHREGNRMPHKSIGHGKGKKLVTATHTYRM